MFFTNGDHRTFESLMRDKSGSNHYDSGKEGRFHVQKIVKAAFFVAQKSFHRETD